MAPTVVTVANGHIELRALDRQLAIARYTSQALGESARLQRIASPKASYPRATISRPSLNLAMPRRGCRSSEPEIARQENLISVLLGRNPATFLGDAKSTPGLFRGCRGTAFITARPLTRLRQSEQQLVAANVNIGVARAALYPVISLTVLLGLASTQLASFSMVRRINGRSAAAFGSRSSWADGCAAGAQPKRCSASPSSIISDRSSARSRMSKMRSSIARSSTRCARSRRNVEALRCFRYLAEPRYKEGATTFLQSRTPSSLR